VNAIVTDYELLKLFADCADNKDFEPVHSIEWVWGESSSQLYS